MSDGTEASLIGAVALLLVKEAFSTIRHLRQRNGSTKADPSSVSLASAPEFALMQRQMLANDEDVKKRLDRIEERLGHHR